MCGGKSTTQQTTTIPPEVLARYNAVNARAEDVAKQPFQQYGGEFVAPLTATQQAGIGNVNQSAGLAQGAFNQAQNVQQNAYSQATPYLQQAMQAANTGYGQASNQFGQAGGYLTNAASQGQIYGGQAYQPIAGALSATQPYMQQATGLVTGGLGAAAPMMGAAEGYLGGGTQAVGPQEFGQAQINKYMSPYMRNVVEAQQALQLQENAAQRNALNAQAIGAGAFGGDRAGISQANLARQQSLANQATLGGLLQQGYGQAANMFQQQQGVNLAAAQANRAAQQFGSQQAANLAQQRYAQQMGAGQQLAALGQQQFGQNIGAGQALAGLGQQMYQQGLGASQAAQGLGAAQYGMGAQQAGLQQGIGSALFGMGTQQAGSLANLGAQQQAAALQGAQAQIGAGTLEQQTNQARDTALYNQFLQERGYPFQVAQFLANIAMGTGALSGSTTTTTQPNSFFSDRRLKKDIKEIGETHDGLPIYSFKYKEGDDQPRIGVMADEARQKHPDAVHRVGGIDAVDYEKIANRASEGGGVMPHRAGEGFTRGGTVSDQDISAIVASARQGDWGPFYQSGLYGDAEKKMPGSAGVVPTKQVSVARVMPHSAPPQQQSGMQQAMSQLRQAEGLGETLLGDKGLVAKGRQAYASLTGANKQQPPSGGGGNVPQPIRSSSSVSAPEAPAPQAQGLGQGSVVGAAKDDILPEFYNDTLPAARGGAIRPGYKFGGGDIYKSENPMIPEEILEVDTPTKLGEDTSRSGGKSGSGSSGLSNLSSAIGLAGTVAKAAPAVIEGIGALAALLPFSDERVKDGMERVGELDNGQPVYKYRIGDGPAQLGLSAQNVSKYGDPSAVYRDHEGFLHLDYERATKNYGGGVRPAFQEGGEAKEYNLDDYMNALRKIESGHNYGAVGPITKKGDRAYGIDQVMGANIPEWTERHYGERLTPQQFLNNPKAQEAVGRGQFSQYLNKYGTPEDAASAWFSGRPMAQAGNAADILGTTVPAYINKFRANLGLEPLGGGVPNDGQRRSVAGAETVIGDDGKRREYVNGQSVGGGGIEPPMNYRTGKPYENWGDFVTSRQFLVPLLSGVGAMASSPSRYFGGALLQGVGAAAQSYAGMEKPMTEGEERRGLAATAAETAKKVAEETKGVTAGLYEKKWIAGMGWFVYDKTKPYEPPMQITDKDLRPIGTKPVDINKIPTAKDSAPGPVPSQAPAAGGTSAPKTGAPSTPATPATPAPSGPPTGNQAIQSLNWKATTEMPQGFVPPNQFNLEMDEEAKRREQNIAATTLRDQRNRSASASRELYRLDEMTSAFNTLPPNGLLSSGKYAPERLNFVKTLNTFSQIAGGKPLWNASEVGAAEQLAKDAFRLGQQAANSAGTVAGRDIIEQSVMATPGMELTAAGFRRVASGMRMAAQYEIDRANFLDSYAGQWGHLSGAEELFNKLNPPSEYARKAVIATIDPALLKRVNAYVEQYKDRPIQQIVEQLAPSIDRLYGTGVTAKILGAK